MNLCFATNNPHKINEIQAMLPPAFRLISLKDIGCDEDLREDGRTLEANALQKARYIHEKYHLICFADDTGLEVEALNGEPGVFSARYAGAHRSDSDNVDLLLSKMENETNRKGRFRTVIALAAGEEEFLFEGIVNGHIARERRGTNGFGYDPVFIPEGFEKTFAEMTMEEKGAISHRGRAVEKLAGFLAVYERALKRNDL